ncbi:MAG: bifunctional 5,10-methylenetetrahydrofolate dehydrogenase/5,10-methenyltetrahydrofolate cyclohydrolase [Parcubacteria group bacterium]
MAQILDGIIVKDKIAERLKEEFKKLRPIPTLAIIQVGDDPRSNAYIKRKITFGEMIGAKVEHLKYPTDISTRELVSIVENKNIDPLTHGIIIQLPLPKHLNPDEVIGIISPLKDVDGLTPTNQDNLSRKKPTLVPATARGIITLLDYYKIPIEGRKVVVVGRSPLVGRPTSLLLESRGAQVTVCHRETKDLAHETQQADILVVAVGKRDLIDKRHVSPRQIVIDVGINAEDGKITGDTVFDEVKDIVRAITPVPGGIGPMTVASLFENLLSAYKKTEITPQ